MPIDLKLRFGAITVSFSLLPLLVFVSLLVLLIALGLWQLDRAQQKTVMLEMQAQRKDEPDIVLTADMPESINGLRYHNASVSGRYDINHQFLLDNQIVAGKAGYFVLTPFIIEQTNRAILVNRGWLPLNKDRRHLPEIGFAQEDQRISGRINNFPSVGIKLEGAEIPAKGWPSVVQLVDTRVLEPLLGYSLFDFQLQLAPDQANGYLRDWKIYNFMPPEKHIAYAVQWFGLAAALVILFFLYGLKYERRR